MEIKCFSALKSAFVTEGWIDFLSWSWAFMTQARRRTCCFTIADNQHLLESDQRIIAGRRATHREVEITRLALGEKQNVLD